MEESRVNSEKEEAALRERMKKLKEKEDNMRSELSEGRIEAERIAEAEATARNRVEEIEEALRESQVALENARAEIEALRADLAVSAPVFEIVQCANSSRTLLNCNVTNQPQIVHRMIFTSKTLK